MNRTLRFLVFATVATSLLTFLAETTARSTYPERPIRLVVGFTAGGNADATARLVATKLAAALGQPVLVDNRPGMAGTLAASSAAQGAPDGYTLFLGSTGSMATAPHLYKKLPYVPQRDFVSVAMLARVPHVLVVNPSLTAPDLRGLVALLKRDSSDPYPYASHGSGTTSHLTMEMLKKEAGVAATHVAYKGSAQAVTDLLAGQVPIMVDVLQTSLPYIRVGKLRALGVSTNARFPGAPEVPTFAELGYPGLSLSPWYGLYAPAGVPATVIERLTAAIESTLTAPDMQEQFLKLGLERMVLTGDAARRFMAAEDLRWAEAVRVSGAQVD